MERTILHLDVDCMFAAVETLLDPTLAGQPVIVGGRPEDRGVVATANYEARAYGVRSAMPMRRAVRLCPHGVFLRPRHEVYREYSRRIFALVHELGAPCEQVSIDEAFVDLTPLVHADANYDATGTLGSRSSAVATSVAIARSLKSAIRESVGLTVSMGLATSRLVAKIACDHGKPDGFLVVPPGDEEVFLSPLPVGNLWGVGPKTATRLAELGISTVGDLAVLPRERLVAALGATFADALLRQARGDDHSPVTTERETKSISEETTFPTDQRDPHVLWRVLQEQTAGCVRSLRDGGFLARSVSIKLRYATFQTITRTVTLTQPTDDLEMVRSAVKSLMRHAWSAERRPLRLIGVRLSNLVAEPAWRQLPLPDV